MLWLQVVTLWLSGGAIGMYRVAPFSCGGVTNGMRYKLEGFLGCVPNVGLVMLGAKLCVWWLTNRYGGRS